MRAKNLVYLGFVRIAMEFSSRFFSVRLALSAITKSLARPEFALPKIQPSSRQQKPPAGVRACMAGTAMPQEGLPAICIATFFYVPFMGREHDRKTDAT